MPGGAAGPSAPPAPSTATTSTDRPATGATRPGKWPRLGRSTREDRVSSGESPGSRTLFAHPVFLSASSDSGTEHVTSSRQSTWVRERCGNAPHDGRPRGPRVRSVNRPWAGCRWRGDAGGPRNGPPGLVFGRLGLRWAGLGCRASARSGAPGGWACRLGPRTGGGAPLRTGVVLSPRWLAGGAH